MVSINEKYLSAIEKLANGYEYEDVQTLLEDTPAGPKKKVIRYKKHMPPNFQAATYPIKRNSRKITPLQEPVEEHSKNIHQFKTEKFVL